MQRLTRISIAAVCALGMTAAIAQTVQPRDQGATQVRPPLQTAQAPAPAGGAATGASGTTAAAGAGMSGGTIALVTLGVVAVVAAVSNTSDSTVTHNP